MNICTIHFLQAASSSDLGLPTALSLAFMLVSTMVVSTIVICKLANRLKRATYKAEHDHLTGVLNRYGGELRVQRLLDTHKPAFIIMVDINSFKDINDNYGHNEGDHVLEAMGRCLLSDRRIVATRIGGDEFVLYCQEEQGADGTSVILQQFLQRLTTIDIPALQGQKVTVSVGSLYYDGSYSAKFDDLYKEADKLCYQEKKNK